jgi:ACS family tartrate transporter-like MFS transporter
MDVEARTLRKISWRLLPLIAISYFVANLDRTNISYAALQMNQDLHLAPDIYGLGAGLFSITYLLFELPSNLVLERVGARLWIARIMITWGIISACMGFVVGPRSFVAMRMLLGAAEAGFVPGILLYITYWFPAALRGRAVAVFLLAGPISNAVSALLSAPILALDGVAGLRGWQWMFIVEALPALILGVVVAVLMTDRPAGAGWLASDEKAWLERAIAEQRPAQHATAAVWRTACHPFVLALGLVYILRNIATFGMTYFLPQIIGTLHLTSGQIGGLTALPYFASAIGMWLWSRSSDRHQERRWHLVTSLLLAAAGLAAAALLSHSLWSLVAIGLAGIGFQACAPLLFAIAPMVLTATETAVGVAVINSLGQLGSLAGPYMVGWVKAETGSFDGAVYAMAASSAAAALVAVMLRLPGRRPAISPALIHDR